MKNIEWRKPFIFVKLMNLKVEEFKKIEKGVEPNLGMATVGFGYKTTGRVRGRFFIPELDPQTRPRDPNPARLINGLFLKP